MVCLRHFNHKEQVWDEYDIITTLNQMTNMDNYDIMETIKMTIIE